ncbi:MAG: hypothetical protein MUF49_28475 [Oculatellaceae cyanobacterium Prado106]|jgi:hypothetical protein|nr:hypothetical protein [Oculatellaceae cyanobacterium Prado106]
MKSKTSDMIRVLNELIPSVKKLNDLFRDGRAEEVLSGLSQLIASIERGESIAQFSRIDQKLEDILARLAKIDPPVPISHQPRPVGDREIGKAIAQATPGTKTATRPMTTPTATPQQATTPPKQAATVKIMLDHGSYAAHHFQTPQGEQRFVMGQWREIPANWLPEIERQVKLSRSWGVAPFKLEVAD